MKSLGYGLKNGTVLLSKFFAYKKEAVEYAKYLVSNRQGFNWKDAYKVIKVKLETVTEDK